MKGFISLVFDFVSFICNILFIYHSFSDNLKERLVILIKRFDKLVELKINYFFLGLSLF